jgi:hypothetical protein
MRSKNPPKTASPDFNKVRVQIFQVDPKYPHLPCGKFVNGDTFSLFLRFNCSIIFGDIDIIMVLRGGHNKK